MFDAIANFFDSIAGIVSTVIESIVNFFSLASDAVSYIVSLVGYLPAFLIPVVTTLLIVFIVRLIAGR